MMRTGAFSRVYWAGTVFALQADVTLRERGSSLDRAVTEAGRRWRGDLSLHDSRDVCASWDRPFGSGVLRPLRDRYAEGVGFPGTSRLLSRLGVTRQNGEVALRRAELSRMRDAIMAR